MRRLIFFAIIIVMAACNLASGLQDGEQSSQNVNAADVSTTSVAQQPTSTATTTMGAVTRTPFPIATSTATPDTQIVLGSAIFGAISQGQSAYGLRIDGLLRGAGLTLLPVPSYQFSQNPANLNRFALIDTSGLLYLTDVGGGNALRIDSGPYTQFLPNDRQTNNAAAELALWSPNGQRLAFIISGRINANDGVWYVEPGVFGPLQLLVDCPFQGFTGCDIVTEPDAYGVWQSRELYWSADSNTLLINVNLPDNGRRALVVMGITQFDRVRDNRPPLLLYDYGTWGSDGRILASGRDPNGAIVVAWINTNGTLSEMVYAASANRLWMGWAVERLNGEVVALGAPGAGGTAVAIYDMEGEALTAPIGDGFPQRVEWSPDRDAVLIEVNGRRYVASVAGEIVEITAQTAGMVVGWVR
ncbi:MAG: hypothetical protein HXY40_11610 [Chloroflexi bacterium]|nr:hypothetical protein [Chloroflexota bacterium]